MSAQGEDLYGTYERAAPGDGDLFARGVVVPALRGWEASPILEVGAGAGATLRELRAAGFVRATGVDASPAQVEAAQAAGVAVELLDGRLALERCEPSSLGAVVMLDVLEHLAFEEQVAWGRLASERLRPGGRVLLRVPNGGGMFGGAIRFGDVTHRSAFTAQSLRQLFKLWTLEEVSVHPCRPIRHGVPSAMRSALWSGVELVLRAADFAESGRLDGIYTRNLFAIAQRSPGAPQAHPRGRRT